MLDQNTAVLLSALLGGLLSIIGGFIANYYVQSASNRVQKQKEIRNIIEQIYKCTQVIDRTYSSLSIGVSAIEVMGEFTKIFDNMEQIELMVDLYLHPLKQSFLEYKGEIEPNLSAYDKHIVHRTDEFTKQEEDTYWFEMASLEEANKKFRASLTKMLKEKGYAYF